MSFEDAMKAIDKKYGEGTIMRLGDASNMDIDVIPTGSLALDLALGVGGIPRGRITELYGLNSAGKTTLCQHIVAEAQKAGGKCAYIDMEHALDREYAKACGVDVDALWLSQPDAGEQALEIAEEIIRTGEATLVVVDSVATLVPRAELEGEMGDSHMGLQARLMSQAMRKLTPVAKTTNTALLFTNQQRMKIGISYGSPWVTSGGNALPFAATVRMEIFHGAAIKQGDNTIGHRAKVKITKNKVAPPFRVAEFDIVFGEGISKTGEILDMGTALNIIAKRGAFFSYGETRLGQGRENAREFLKANPELATQIAAEIRANGKADLMKSDTESEEEI